MEGSGEFPLGGKAVVEIDKGEAPACHIHGIPAVDLLAAVDIAAAVDADNGGQGLVCAIRVADIQQMPLAFGTVGDIPTFGYTLRQRNGGIPFAV